MAARLWRVIKPERLRDKDMRLELLNALGRMGTKVRQDFQKTVSTWENKPKFDIKQSLKGGRATIVVDTDSNIYRYLDKGTKPHPIFARPGSALRFQGVYTAKTIPDVIDSQSGGKSGDWVFAKSVQHPGFEARNFSKAIAAKWRKLYRVEMDDAMAKAAAKSGHRM